MTEKDSLEEDDAPSPRTVTAVPHREPRDRGPAATVIAEDVPPAVAGLSESVDVLVARIAASLAAHAIATADAARAPPAEASPVPVPDASAASLVTPFARARIVSLEPRPLEQRKVASDPTPSLPPADEPEAPGARPLGQSPEPDAGTGQQECAPALPLEQGLPLVPAARAETPATPTPIVPERIREPGRDGPRLFEPSAHGQPELPHEENQDRPAELKTAASGTAEASIARDYKRLARTGLKYALFAFGGYLALVLALIPLYRFVNPPTSTLMLFQRLTGREVRQSWMPLESISPHLVRAVIISEDGRFCDHWGVDPEAIEEAIARAKDGLPRGASTISMQVTKNIFLWPTKSYLRKAIEIPVTLVMELVWPKWRVLEVYLNVAEWGPGVFGAEEAARHHFNKPAAKLSEREAALLAASLPNPMRRDAGEPGPQTQRKAGIIQGRVRAGGKEAARCVLPAG